MADLQAPAVVDIVEAAEAEAVVDGVIDVLGGPGGIVRSEKLDIAQVGGRLESRSLGIHRHAIGTGRAFGPETGAFAGIASAGHVVDIATHAVNIDNTAEGEGIGHRQVEHAGDVAAHVAAPGEGSSQFDAAIGAAGVGLVGDQSHRASLGAAAKEGTLGPRQHLDPVQVCGIDVQVASGLGQGLIVKIEGNVGCQAGNTGGGEVGRGRGNAADVDGVLARAAAAGGDAGQLDQVVIEIGDPHVVEGIFAQRLYRDGNVLGAGDALGGGDQNLLQPLRGSAGGDCRARDRTDYGAVEPASLTECCSAGHCLIPWLLRSGWWQVVR